MKKRIFIGILLVFSLVIISCNLHEKNLKIDDDNILGIYLDNELQTSIPKKGEAVFSKAVCDNDEVNYYWDIDNWGLYINNLSNKMKCNLYFVNYSGQTTFDFDYTGIEQTFTAPVSGTYRLETWGAQGGNGYDGYTIGGYGGYSIGTINLKINDNIFINVGGQGAINNSDVGKITSGGYNGGGATFADETVFLNYGASGAFGIGGKSGPNSGGGGSGYYGGGGGTRANDDSSGAGGSGYVGNSLLKNKVMYCYNCEESNEENTKTISTTCNEETPTVNCSKKGNGYARITLVSIDN